MQRRNALKLMGAMIVLFSGHSVAEEEQPPKPETEGNSESTYGPVFLKNEPLNFQVDEDAFKNLIIVRKSGKTITIPFSEIVDALDS